MLEAVRVCEGGLYRGAIVCGGQIENAQTETAYSSACLQGAGETHSCVMCREAGGSPDIRGESR